MDPVNEKPIVIKEGRFGAYITDGETNITVPRGETIDEMTHERAVELLADKRAKGPAKKKPRARQEGACEEARGEEARCQEACAQEVVAAAAAKSQPRRRAGPDSRGIAPPALPRRRTSGPAPTRTSGPAPTRRHRPGPHSPPPSSPDMGVGFRRIRRPCPEIRGKPAQASARRGRHAVAAPSEHELPLDPAAVPTRERS